MTDDELVRELRRRAQTDSPVHSLMNEAAECIESLSARVAELEDEWGVLFEDAVAPMHSDEKFVRGAAHSLGGRVMRRTVGPWKEVTTDGE